MSTLKSRAPSLPAPTPSSLSPTSQLRSLIFHGSLTLSITLSSSSPAITFYLQAARISYLPLLLPVIRSTYLPLITDEVVDGEGMWFDYKGVPLKWHWPIGLLYDYHTTSSPSPLSLFPSSPPPPTAGIFPLTLHLSSPPTEQLLISNSIEVCKTGFMHQLKEADFVRWGNTKRVVNLRREEQGGIWEGVVENDYSKFYSTASRLIPLPSTGSSRAPTPESTEPTMRSVPIRVYLPDGGPVLQDVVPPIRDDGAPTTLAHLLTSLLPLLFPPAPKKPLAKVLVAGIFVPLETEVGWLGGVMGGGDGWVGVVVVLD